MLPDLRPVRDAVDEFLSEFLKRQSFAQTGVWQQVRKHVVMYECSGFEQHRFDGSVDDQELARIGGAIRLDLKELQSRGFAAVLEAYDKAAAELGQNMARFSWSRAKEIIEEAGQSVDAGGRPLTPDLFLEALEKIEIEFGRDGKPSFPTFVIPPNLAGTIRNWTITDEQQRKFEQLVEQKRLAWRDRESNRKLVD